MSMLHLIVSIYTSNTINLNIVWIPRDINNIADFFSLKLLIMKTSVTEIFFILYSMCRFSMSVSADLFANPLNSKV